MSPSLGRLGDWLRSQDPLEVGALLTMGVASIAVCGAVLLTRDPLSADFPIAQRTDRAEHVLVVTGEGSADGLVAESLGDEVLTIARAQDPRALIADIMERLNPTRVVILGGPDVVSPETAAALTAATMAPVTRLAGQDRYATAAQAAVSTFEAPVREVVIATSELSPGAVRATGTATAGVPVLLVTPDRVPAPTMRALQQLRPASLTILGGVSAVSDAVMQELQKYTSGRVTGAASA